MPNNPASRRAGSVTVASGNKIVRGSELNRSLVALAASSTPAVSSTSESTPDASPFPAGLICMWHGLLANVPAGWALCDGTGGTPDLRGKFVKGTAVGVDPGGTGGAATHTPTGAVGAPSFTGASANTTAESAHTHSFTSSTNAATPHLLGIDLITGVAASGTTGAGSSHLHAYVPSGTNSAPAFTGDDADYQPAFYEIAYIMKLAGS